MEINTLLSYMSEYGLLLMAIIIFLEYLNLPGFPAGIILPVAGIWTSNSNTNFWFVLGISVLSALIASWILYAIGWYFGDFILTKYLKRFPKQENIIQKQLNYLQQMGYLWVLISKLIPMVRTIISLPAGLLKLNFFTYTIASTIGITIWNAVLIYSGYLFKEEILSQFI